jgi:hypothetical protein
MVMKELHERPSRGHFATELMQRNILDARYWWPTMYRDVQEYYKSCDACQRTRGLATQSLAKLVTSFPEEPFMKWGLDFVGLIKLTRRYIGNNIFLWP